MSGPAAAKQFFIGWDVGGWNCDRNRSSRDAIVILDTERRIVGTPWAIHYWPHETGVLDSDGQLQFIAAFALAAGLLALILVFYGLVLSRMVRADILRLVDAIIDGSRGKRSHGWPVKLAESRAVLHAREGELRVLHYGDESSQRPTVAGEVEMPDILFGSEDDIQVDEASDQADSPDRRE